MVEDVVLAQIKTDIGTFFLRQRETVDGSRWVYEIYIGESLLMSTVSPVSEERLSIGALDVHPGEGPLRVLVGGLGLGYTARAALADRRVGEVRVVEKMAFVIDWMERGLFPLSEEFAVDDRLEIVQGDVYAELLGPATSTYDLVLVDVDHAPKDPLSPASEPFYTVEGQRRVAHHLRPGGVLGVWSAFDDEDFAQVLAQVYCDGHREEVIWPDDESPGLTYENMVFYARTAPEKSPST